MRANCSCLYCFFLGFFFSVSINLSVCSVCVQRLHFFFLSFPFICPNSANNDPSQSKIEGERVCLLGGLLRNLCSEKCLLAQQLKSRLAKRNVSMPTARRNIFNSPVIFSPIISEMDGTPLRRAAGSQPERPPLPPEPSHKLSLLIRVGLTGVLFRFTFNVNMWS